MRCLIGVVVVFSLSGAAFAQGPNQAWSLGGYGSILQPGLGHVPTVPPGGVTGPYFGNSLGVSGFSAFAGGAGGHPQHRRAVVVPYPVYYGGYNYGYGYGYDPSLGYVPPGYSDPNAAANANGVPSVVINQNYVPPTANPQVREYTAPSDNSQDQQSGMKLYQTPPTHPYADAQQNSATGHDDTPTLYLIAFKDHTIVQALGYWMEGSTLHYVSVEHSLNQASMDLIDRDLSQRLNDERGVQFKLPAVH